jgi:mannose-6-phosphate isomerase
VVPGTTRAQFETALQAGQVSECLNRFVSRDGDFFFMPARTVHALGRGCLLVEVKQTCDVTFRVDDWGRVGLDGKPRPLHVRESLATIDFRPGISAAGPISAVPVEHPSGGSVRRLVQCPYFSVEERLAHRTGGGLPGACSIIVNLGPACRLATAAGEVLVPAMRTALVAASAGAWNAVSADGAQPLRLLVAHPV